MSYGSFEQWLNYSFTPCGIVYSSELAKKIFNKNNISPSEFLRPFFDFKNKEFTINLGEENSGPYSDLSVVVFPSNEENDEDDFGILGVLEKNNKKLSQGEQH